MERKTQINIIYGIIAVFSILMLQSWWQQSQRVEVIPYSEFQQFISDGKIAEVVVTESQIRGTLKAPLPDGKMTFATTRVEPDLAASMAKHGVKVTGGTDESVLKSLFSWLLPMLIFLGVWMFVIRGFAEKQGLGGMGGAGDGARDGRGRHGRRDAVDRQKQGQGVRRKRYPGQLR